MELLPKALNSMMRVAVAALVRLESESQRQLAARLDATMAILQELLPI